MQYSIVMYTRYSRTPMSIPVEKIPGSEILNGKISTVDVRLQNDEVITVDSRDVFITDENVTKAFQ